MSVSSVVISGLGAVTPYGAGVARLWQGLLQAESGISDFTRFDLGGIACTRGGVITDYQAPQVAGRPPPPDLATGYALGAALEAMREAGVDGSRLGIITASNFGALDEGEQALAGTLPDTSLAACAQETTTNRLAALLELRGPAITLSLSCAASAAALAHAADLISSGAAGQLLVVGYDALSRAAWSGLCALRTMTRDLVRPFDLNRSGTLFSEGASALLLEREAECRQRGAQPLARLSGWATGNNGFHMTAPPARAAGSADVMRRALKRAALTPAEVDHVNLHGTGTKPNDLTEAQALHDIFGSRIEQLPVTANKGAIGHLLGAAGGIEAIASILSLQQGVIPPTANFITPDPAAAVALVVGEPRRVTLRHVLSNSAGFGGCNAALLLSLP